MVVRASRRLPGFRFEYQPPPPTDVLPRMDVAVFVGFAASGPLHVPVAVEDGTQFTTIFGDDVPLAWDAKRSEQVYAYLAPAVRAFFRNGGKRCWVIRVAGDKAQYNYFPVPGLALVDADGTITPAFARARSQGSWSDELRVGASLISRPIFASPPFSLQGSVTVNLALESPGDISAGDLVRLTFSDGEYVLMMLVAAARAIDAASISSPPDGPSNHSIVQVTARTRCWLKAGPPRSPLPSPTRALMFVHDAPLPPVAVTDYEENDQAITLNLSVPFSNAPEPGAMIRVDFDTDQLWLTVQSAHVKQDSGSPPADVVVVTGQGLWLVQDGPNPWPTEISRAEMLSFKLWVRKGTDYPQALSDLAFGEDHPRFWKALPADDQFYRNAVMTSDPMHSVVSKAVSHTPYTDLWQSALNPRFPLAGSDAPGVFYLPIAMPVSTDYYLGLDKGSKGQFATPRARDGLSEFSINLFLDVDMVEALTTDLMMQADYLRYQTAEIASKEDIQFRTLKGIYAALNVEEASIIAVPDAYQRGWMPALVGDPQAPLKSKPLPHPEWWHCGDEMASDDGQTVQQPPQGTFHNCDVQVIAPPILHVLDGPDESGTYRLGWTAQVAGCVTYTLEEALRPDWIDAVTIFEGEGQFIGLYGRGQGDYFYRVRAKVGDDSSNSTPASSDWSEGIAVRVATMDRWQLQEADEYDAQGLIALQRALVRMCAARGDLLAVLALPEHYHEDDAIAHIARLKSLKQPIYLQTASDPNGDDVRMVSPLGYGERSAFSYAALYYPWVNVSEDNNQLKNIPPDGTACGIMALRALARGAWIAPANELLTGVVDLMPPVSHVNWQRLQDAQVNLIRHEPRGILFLNADTLSDEEDDDLRPINVRRLLILLRRLALRLGATYVFEPNSAAFRRLVQRGFEAMLDQMFTRGAFAGSTPDTSFQVVTDSSLNTPQSVDLGRFIVELGVAPSLPMTFLTVRLVQSATGGSVTEVR